MYTYPIKFEFPMISIGRQVNVLNGDGKFIMSAKDPFISFKDSMSVVDGRGNQVFQFNGDSNFRFLFQFASVSTEWNIRTSDGKQMATLGSYWARMEEFKDVRVDLNAPAMTDDGTPNIMGNVFGNLASNVVNGAIRSSVPSRLVYRVRENEESSNVLGWIVPSRGTAWFDFLPYSTRIQLLNIPFAARFYAPSYEFKLGNLYGPTVLTLKKQRDMLVDKYTLEKSGELTDAQERWVIPALTLTAMFERTRVKQMADW